MSEKLEITKQPGFIKLWVGQTVSSFGSQISGLALPVIAVTLLNATEFQMGLLNAANTSAFLVFGLLAGALVDRWIKRQVMITADLIRMVAIGLIPVLWFAGILNIYHLIAIGMIVSIASVFFDVSYQSYIPILLPREYISLANSRMELTAQISGVASPSIVGVLLTVVKAPVLLIFDAISFFISAFSLLLIRDREIPKDKLTRRRITVEIAEGLRFVWNQKLIRAISFTTSTGNLFSTISGTMFAIYFFRESYLGFNTAAFGILTAVGSVGGLLGAASTPKLIKFLGEGPLIVISAITMGASQLLVVLSWYVGREFALAVLLINAFVTAFTVLTYNITQVSARQRLCPENLLGRMNASIRFMVWGCMPIGALISGSLGELIGVVPTITIGAIGGLFAAGFVLFSPIRKMREMPTLPKD
ncbi:MAG: MFS transporter [Microbacteriaceae bacterium]|nr:MFS transporter [Microbacteriaceae bacterium]